MEKDELDREVSVSAELTKTGIKASANSRTISAFDRLGGHYLRKMFARGERQNAEEAAINRGRVAVIEKITELGLARLERNPEFANAAIENHFATIFGRQENKIGVVQHALEDLRRQPPTEEESASGPDKLSPEFTARHERYAEDATSDELRERWGRVLAAEIRKPGTFSPRVLRIIDELDAGTAVLFERVCQHRWRDGLVRALVGELPFLERKMLVEAGLIIDPGLTGHSIQGSEKDTSDGKRLWLWGDGISAFSISCENVTSANSKVLDVSNGTPSIPVYALTQVGQAISSILPTNSSKMTLELLSIIRDAAATCQVVRYLAIGAIYTPVEIFPPVTPQI